MSRRDRRDRLDRLVSAHTALGPPLREAVAQMANSYDLRGYRHTYRELKRTRRRQHRTVVRWIKSHRSPTRLQRFGWEFMDSFRQLWVNLTRA